MGEDSGGTRRGVPGALLAPGRPMDACTESPPPRVPFRWQPAPAVTSSAVSAPHSFSLPPACPSTSLAPLFSLLHVAGRVSLLASPQPPPPLPLPGADVAASLPPYPLTALPHARRPFRAQPPRVSRWPAPGPPRQTRPLAHPGGPPARPPATGAVPGPDIPRPALRRCPLGPVTADSRLLAQPCTSPRLLTSSTPSPGTMVRVTLPPPPVPPRLTPSASRFSSSASPSSSCRPRTLTTMAQRYGPQTLRRRQCSPIRPFRCGISPRRVRFLQLMRTT